MKLEIKMVNVKVIPYIPPRIRLCKYSKDSCNITVVEINSFQVRFVFCIKVWGTAAKWDLDFNLFSGQWFEHYGGLQGNEDWSPPKKYARLFQQILAGSKFCQNPFRKYCRYRYGFTLLRKHHISRGHSRDLSKNIKLWNDTAHFFHFPVHLKCGSKSDCEGSRPSK